MKRSTLLSALWASSLSLASCSGLLRASTDAAPEVQALALSALLKRAVSDSPSGGYAPDEVDCPPNRPTVRDASSLSQNETAWLRLRRDNTFNPMRELLNRMNITGFDASSYMDNHRDNSSALPNVAMAFSGGGYRALMNGAGAFAAFDSRTPNATNAGHLGGLLQSSTYVAGLSGGGWLVGSIYVNNFSTVPALQVDQSSTVWELSDSIVSGPGDGSVFTSLDYYQKVYDGVQSKNQAGFNTTITDYWGRSLSYQLINASEGGPGYTWSSISRDEQFAGGQAPMPILVADGRAPGELLISSNATVFEFTPWELGSWDPTTYGFAPLRYLGSNFTAGRVPDGQSCVRGFDNAGFVMGTSSSLFNAILLELNNLSVPDLLKGAFSKIITDVSGAEEDIARYEPNPFFQYNTEENLSAQSKVLTLVDGGEDLQNIPLHPLIQPVRDVDVIFAVDSSADTSNWPNGTALVATYQRSVSTIQNGTAFPSIPDQNTFVNLGLNTRPTFFGCDPRNMTGPAPLVVYIPNSPYTYNSNVSTQTMSYEDAERNNIITNGYNVATMGNATQDRDWPACVGCAMLSRSFDRTGTQVPQICQTCFQRYCWDGTRNSTEPQMYQPTFKVAGVTAPSSAARLHRGVLALLLWLAPVWVAAFVFM